MATELGTAYVSIVAETSKLEAGIKAALDGGGKHSDIVGKDIGKRISESASKALKDGWRPDQDIMAGIPNTKLDHIGARIGQVIGKGMVANLRAREAGVQFANSFGEGAGSIGLGRVVAGWRKEIAGSGGGALNTIGFLAGKSLSAGLTAAAGAGVAGIGLALTKGFERLEKIDSATSKLNQMNKVAERMGKPLIDVQKTVTAVKDSVYGTPYSLDAAFGIAVQAIGAGSKDIGKFMKDVTDAAGFAGDDLGHMGLVLTQVLSKGKADGGDMMQLMEAGLPAKSWIEDSYNLTSDQFEKMQHDGEITMDMLQKSIEDHAGGMAKAAGDTLEGSIGNMQTAVARAGADFLSAIFGGPGGDPTDGMKQAVNRITDYLKKLDDWINQHREDIKKFFDGAKEAAADVLKVVGNLGDVLKTHPDLIKNVLEAFALWKTIQFTGLLTGLANVSNALGSKGGVGLLGKLALVAEAMNLIDDYTNRQKPGKPGEFEPSKPLNEGPPLGKQALDTAAGAYAGFKFGGVPGALFGGLAASVIRPGIDIVSPGPGPATNGALPTGLPNVGAPGQLNAQEPSVGGIPIPGLTIQPAPQQKITPTVDIAPAMSTLDKLLATIAEPVVIPADADTEPAASTTGTWRIGESGNPVLIPVDADTSSASASMAAFIDKWSSAIISPQVVVPGQVTTGATGKPLTLPGMLGIPGKAAGGSISGPGSGTSDSIPALLSNGEHVLTSKDVEKMGGQSGVYRFRNMLQKFGGGGLATHMPSVGDEGGASPIFTTEGPSLYGKAFIRNQQFAMPSSTNWQTKLEPKDEAEFRNWVNQNKVPFDVQAAISDYDMRGFWKDGGQWQGGHFPDTYKTPYDTSFSSESRYAVPGTPFVWRDNNLVDTRTGNPVYVSGYAAGGPVGSIRAYELGGAAINFRKYFKHFSGGGGWPWKQTADIFTPGDVTENLEGDTVNGPNATNKYERQLERLPKSIVTPSHADNLAQRATFSGRYNPLIPGYLTTAGQPDWGVPSAGDFAPPNLPNGKGQVNPNFQIDISHANYSDQIQNTFMRDYNYDGGLKNGILGKLMPGRMDPSFLLQQAMAGPDGYIPQMDYQNAPQYLKDMLFGRKNVPFYPAEAIKDPNLLGGAGQFANGGAMFGPGSATSDSIFAMLSNGEHVLSASDVDAMGGQESVYQFRKFLHKFASGGSVSNGLLKDMRTAGAIPAAAGSTAKAGTSGVASLIGMGGEVINGIIDQAASAVSTAASAAATGASMGAAGPAGGEAAGAASQFAIGLASNTAKRGVKYGFDLLGIGADSLLQQLTPFGQPRWLNQDYTGFVPKEQITTALGNLMTGGAKKPDSTVDPNTTEHGTSGGAEPGAAVPGPLETLGQQIFDGFSKALPSGPIEPVAPTPMVGDANSFLSTQLAAPSSPPPPGQQPIFKVDNIYTQDVDSLGRELNKQGRLAQMQYTNRPGP